MPLPSFATKDEIPEPFRDSYVEKDGKWVPDDSGLRESQRRLLDENKKLDGTLRGLLGSRKPEEIAAILAEHETLAEERQRKAGDFDKLLEKRVNETKAEYERRIAELAPYKTRYEDSVLETSIRDAFTKAGGVAEDIKLVIPIVKGSRVRLDEKTGKPVVFDSEGDPTGLTVEKFFAETFKTEASKFYVATGGSGGGSSGGNGSTRGSTAPGTVSKSDNNAIVANLDGIAKGTVKVA